MTVLRLLVVLTAAALLAGGAKAVPHVACSTNEGGVETYDPTAGHSCPGVLLSGIDLFRAETVNTGSPGGLTFRTNHIFRCIESSNAKDRLLPSATVALLHLAGKTWCWKKENGPKITLKTKYAKILVSGTIFGLDATREGDLIKVADGRLAVGGNRAPGFVTVAAGSQILVPPTGRPTKPRPLTLDADDTQSVTFMRFDVLPSGQGQAKEFLTSRGQKTAAVLAETSTALGSIRKSLAGVKLASLLGDRFDADPRVIEKAVSSVRAATIVVAGDFTTMAARFPKIREVVAPEIQLVFVSVKG